MKKGKVTIPVQDYDRFCHIERELLAITTEERSLLKKIEGDNDLTVPNLVVINERLKKHIDKLEKKYKVDMEFQRSRFEEAFQHMMKTEDKYEKTLKMSVWQFIKHKRNQNN